MTAAVHPTWTTPGGEPETSTPTRRQLARQIAAERAEAGHPISASKANRLAVRQLRDRARATSDEVDITEPKRISYRDETGDTAVWNVLSGGGRFA